MKILPRSAWSARPPKRRHTITTPTPELWLHHTAGAEDAGHDGRWADDVAGIQRFHQDMRGWTDIAYSFLVDASGQVWEGRGPGIAGGHTKGRNTVSHGICAIGNYDQTEPSEELLESLAQLVAHGLLAGWWATTITGGHREAPGAATACPGRHLMAKMGSVNARAAEIAVEVGEAGPSLLDLRDPPTIPEDDVRRFYRLFTGREGDEVGVEHWARAGVTKAELAVILLEAEGMDRIWDRLARLVASQ